MEDMVSFYDVSLWIGEKRILGHIDFNLSVGESLMLVGESGSGKTQLSKLLLGYRPIDGALKGKLIVQGDSLFDLSEKDLRRFRGQNIAYLPQNPMAMFNPFQMIKHHIIETLRSHKKLDKKSCLKLIAPYFRRVRLGHTDKLLNSYPFELSGGTLQRIMLALVLCLDTKLLVLDEPTSALDAYNREQVLKILKQLKHNGKTMVITTHDYDLVRELGDKIIVLYKGKIVDSGEAKELLNSPNHSYSRELFLGNPYKRLVVSDD